MIFRPSVLRATAVVLWCTAVLLASCKAPESAPPPPAPAVKKKGKVTPTPSPTPAPAAVVTPTQKPGPMAPTDQFKVAVERTPFYNYGPQQPGGPNLSLEKGALVKLIKRGFGYSQVQLKDQQTGYVATEDIAAMTPQELAAVDAGTRPPADLGPLPRPGGVRRSSIPPITFEELPQPDPKADAKPEASPKPGSTPSFRY